jgi:hypothetical protein
MKFMGRMVLSVRTRRSERRGERRPEVIGIILGKVVQTVDVINVDHVAQGATPVTSSPDLGIRA